MSAPVHHLNCATMRPAAARFGLVPERLVAHCLLIERADGLTLVDTGLGTADLTSPHRLGTAFLKGIGPALLREETALAQVRRLGHDPRDVTDIVLTHLDVDHAGGIADFPHARVHVLADELAAAVARRSVRERNRYVAAQWAHGPVWVEHLVDGGQSWFGFESVGVLSDEVLLVPLAGHTRGHCGVAVRGPSGDWLLHAGDAYFFHGEKHRPPVCPPGLRVFQGAVQMDRRARLDNAERLRELVAERSAEVTVFSAHDATEFDALAE